MVVHAMSAGVAQTSIQGAVMSHCSTILRLTVAALATTALAAPTAIAMPIEPGTNGTGSIAAQARAQDSDASTAKTEPQKDPRQLDMHASTVQPPAVQQEQRTPDALDASPAPKPQVIPRGMPTWPVNPQTLPQPQRPEAVPATGGDGGGIDWEIPAIALAASLLLGGALVVARTRLRGAGTSAAH
jgi:hypothetical protein